MMVRLGYIDASEPLLEDESSKEEYDETWRCDSLQVVTLNHVNARG